MKLSPQNPPPLVVAVHCLVDPSHPCLLGLPLLAAEGELSSLEAVATRRWAEDMVALAYILQACEMWTYWMNLCHLRLAVMASTHHLPAPHPKEPLERITVLLSDPL